MLYDYQDLGAKANTECDLTRVRARKIDTKFSLRGDRNPEFGSDRKPPTAHTPTAR